MRRFTLLVKPAGPDCNLNCTYCFYTRKTALFGPGKHRMSDHVLEKLITDYLRLGFPDSSFAWQGGEPTLMGLDFYQKVVALQKRIGRNGQLVSNALQTNATLLTDDWFGFLHEYKFLLGISLDGPERFHDHYRLDHAGCGSWARVTAAIENCRRHRVEFNILVLLNSKNADHPDELFDYFIDRKIRFLQIVPCAEKDPATGQVAEFSVTPQQYGHFLCRLFDRWLDYGPEKLSVRLFDSIMHYYLQGRHTNCTFGQRCDDYVVVEHNGDVFACDFFVEDRWKLGNLLETPLEELFNGSVKHTFARRKRAVSNQCFVCRHQDLCRGGCPKDRTVLNDDPKELNYFCPSYKKFFEHALPTLMQLVTQYQLRANGASS